MAEVNQGEFSSPCTGLGSVSVFSGGSEGNAGGDEESKDWKYHTIEFAKGLAEMTVEFGRGVRDVVKQSVLTKDSYFVRNFGEPCEKVCANLSFLNEYLPEDRDPVHSWTVIFFVALVAIAALCINDGCDTTTPLVKRLYIHPPNARRILLPDGRYLAYQEHGILADRARFSLISAHPFLSSRLSGIPGLKASLLEEFGIRLVTYDLPGFGESDPHPNRNLQSSALDLLQLSYAVNVTEKFWVLGYSGGSMHAWAALRYIPDRITAESAGAVMVAPVVNPYDPIMTNRERSRIWNNWTWRRKLMLFLARRFPISLPYLYHRSFMSGNHGRIYKWLSLSLGKRDLSLIEERIFEELWERDVEESVRQRNVKPFVEEAVLQVSDWGFRLSDLKIQKKRKRKGIFLWLKSMYIIQTTTAAAEAAEEELTGFLGPIHIWQGMDDRVVPPSVTDFVQKLIPGAMVHKLLYHGHFTYFYFCDECHKQIFTTVFGNPQGPLPAEVEENQTKVNSKDEEEELGDTVMGDTVMD